ncbi:bifunctional riboflavin kinase/FAD synthetase [Thermogutta sp.]|uniref:bifunctional riboflavin kinase/FAD synthetase n=1 Tax=Thermogutta sp. TaxID=1962930 RepID=UPI003220338A
MIIYRELDEIQDLKGSVVSVGNFDGVHRGHARLIEVLCQTAQKLGVPSLVVTFHPHPAAILNPDRAPPPLTWLDRKLTLLSHTGVDRVLVYPTNRQLLEMSPELFFHEILVTRLKARAIVEGADFRFGKDRAGDIRLLQSMCSQQGIDCHIVPPVLFNNEPVSSSRIRQCLLEGKLGDVTAMLGRPFRTVGKVVRGAGRGTHLGFPTANLNDVPTLLPREGIYAGIVPLHGRLYPAAISLGGNPTFEECQRKFEVYILDFTGNLYGHLLEVDFLEYLREICRYDSVDALIAQMNHDVSQVRTVFERYLAETKAESAG